MAGRTAFLTKFRMLETEKNNFVETFAAGMAEEHGTSSFHCSERRRKCGPAMRRGDWRRSHGEVRKLGPVVEQVVDELVLHGIVDGASAKILCNRR